MPENKDREGSTRQGHPVLGKVGFRVHPDLRLDDGVRAALVDADEGLVPSPAASTPRGVRPWASPETCGIRHSGGTLAPRTLPMTLRHAQIGAPLAQGRYRQPGATRGPPPAFVRRVLLEHDPFPYRPALQQRPRLRTPSYLLTVWAPQGDSASPWRW